jgi:hypothetical protein
MAPLSASRREGSARSHSICGAWSSSVRSSSNGMHIKPLPSWLYMDTHLASGLSTAELRQW